MPEVMEVRLAPMRYLRLVARRFDASDARSVAVFEGVGLTAEDLEAPGLEVSFAQQARLFDNLMRIFGDGWILDTPEVWTPASQGALSIAALSAATVGDAMSILAAYISVQAANQRLTVVHEDGRVVLRHSLRGELPASWAWVSTLSGVLCIAETLKLLVGRAQTETRYEFAREAPDYAERLQGMLGGEIRWGAGGAAVILPQRLMEARSPFHDPITNDAALQRLEQAKRSERDACSVRGRVEHLLSISESGRLPSGEAARILGLSKRTMARRMAESGVSYRELVDAEMRTRAKRWLASSAMSRVEIGERLGFADPTSFRRACRRWFNLST